MKVAQQLRFDYAGLDPDTRSFIIERAERIHNLARMTAAGIVQIGQYLTEVKERLKHGQFLDWIEREFSWNRQSAWAFMKVHECFKSSNFEHLEIDVSALYLIAAPSMPEPVRTQVITRAENGERITHSGARALVQHFAETGEVPDIETDLGELIAKQRKQLEGSEGTTAALTQQERRKLETLREEREQATARVVKVMTVIEAIEHIAQSQLSMQEIAGEIDQFDTPDKDWHQKAKQAHRELGKLCQEFKRK
jgi:hypothetical protein